MMRTTQFFAVLLGALLLSGCVGEADEGAPPSTPGSASKRRQVEVAISPPTLGNGHPEHEPAAGSSPVGPSVDATISPGSYTQLWTPTGLSQPITWTLDKPTDASGNVMSAYSFEIIQTDTTPAGQAHEIVLKDGTVTGNPTITTFGILAGPGFQGARMAFMHWNGSSWQAFVAFGA